MLLTACARQTRSWTMLLLWASQQKKEKRFSSSPSQHFSISMSNLVFSGLIHTMFAPYCCTVRTLVATIRTPHVVPHKRSGIWSKTLVCYHTPSFPTACSVSGSLTSMDPSLRAMQPSQHLRWMQGCREQSQSDSVRRERKAATAAVSGLGCLRFIPKSSG